jgi:heme exporter protein A
MREPASDLIAENLACRRGARLVFTGVSFCLPAGGALVLTGANGSGKSSLLRLAGGLLAPAEGRLLWGGAPVAADIAGHHSRLHYVGHQDAVKPAMTPREILRFWTALRGLNRAAAAVQDAAAAFGLDGVADWPGSGGAWRSRACWCHLHRFGSSTSRRALSTTTARPGSNR